MSTSTQAALATASNAHKAIASGVDLSEKARKELHSATSGALHYLDLCERGDATFDFNSRAMNVLRDALRSDKFHSAQRDSQLKGDHQ